MTNRLLFSVAGALLGAFSALAAALAFVAGLFWLSDQSSVRESGITLLVALALLLVAGGATLTRRWLLRMLAQSQRADDRERAV
jgi:high-affinity Fe2+/Pb2+ permease